MAFVNNSPSPFLKSGTLISFKTSGDKLNLVSGTLTDGVSALYLSATMPATITAANYAINWQITGAGASAQRNCAFSVDYLAGYTGAKESITARFVNRQAGTGATPLLSGVNVANFGFYGGALGTTTGTNVGAYGTAYGGNVNYGLIGECVTNKTDAKNIAVAGFASQTTGTPIQIGGFFGLMTTEPTYASAALLCDNGATTSDIFVARDNGTEVFSISNNGTDHLVNITGGTMTDGVSAFYVSATMPTTITANTNAVNYQITSAGSSNFAQVGFLTYLTAGYVGANATEAIAGVNLAAGTGTDYFNVLTGNWGILGLAIGTTVGTNIGIMGGAQSGNKNIGVVGRSVITKNGATNIGVVGYGANAGTSPIVIGGYFGLNTAEPTFTSAALLADNGATTNPIAIFRDEGTPVFSILDGGLQTGKQGTDVASANDATLTATGNYFDVTGTTQTNTLSIPTGVVAGTVIRLQFDGSVTVKHATAGTGAQFQLAGAGDFSATAGDTLTLVYDGTYWRELARTAI